MTGTGIFDDWSGRWIFGNDRMTLTSSFTTFRLSLKLVCDSTDLLISKLEA